MYLRGQPNPSYLAIGVQLDSFLMLNWQDILLVIRCSAAGRILYLILPFTSPLIRCTIELSLTQYCTSRHCRLRCLSSLLTHNNNNRRSDVFRQPAVPEHPHRDLSQRRPQEEASLRPGEMAVGRLQRCSQVIKGKSKPSKV